MAKVDARKLKDDAAAAARDRKWKKALEHYLALEEAEPQNGMWPQKSGEMSRKLERKDDAIAAYLRAADAYSKAGFLVKAIAVCKLILAIDPTHTSTQEKLAGLHSDRGLPAPAAAGRAIPRGATLDEVSLGAIVPGARRSREMPAQPVMEIPLEVSAAYADFAVEAPGAGTVQRAAEAVLPRTPLFSALDAGRLRTLIDRVRLCELGPGETLFAQGDDGDALYVIADGEVAVLSGGVEVARLAEGAFFGEIAILTRQPRSATIRAVADTRLIALDRDVIGEVVADSPEVLKVLLRFLRDRLLDTLVDTSRLFAPFSGPERQSLAARFRLLEAEPGAEIVTQGMKTPGLYILLAGRASVHLEDRVIAELGPGDLFGEISLLTHGPAVASIRAGGRCHLLELPRADFFEVIMTHPQVLELVNELAEDRKKLLGAIQDGSVAYREEHLTLL